MSSQMSSNGPEQPARNGAGPGAILLLSAALVLSGACTPEQRHSVLTFFFDGVDTVKREETTVKPEEQPEVVGQTEKPKIPMHKHQPYEQGKCDDCHGGRTTMMISPDPKTLCTKCHTDFGGDWKFEHGPTAAGACTQCHSPHESQYAKLLVEEPPALCAKCHNTSDAAFRASAPAHATDANCIVCHDPHGADGRYFLKHAKPAVVPDTEISLSAVQ